MASLSSRRIANSITLSLNFATRSRTLAFSVTSTEHARHRRHRSHPNRNASYSRQFSSQSCFRQEANQNTATSQSTSKFPPSNASTKPPTISEPPPSTQRNESANATQLHPIQELTKGLSDTPATVDDAESGIDWTSSFQGLSTGAFSREAQDILMKPLDVDDVEIKAEGLLYLPEIKYRRILNKAFGPGAWGLAPRGPTTVTGKSVTREYALLVHGRLVSISRGEQDYFDKDGIATATEGCKSNALMRCCKDLGIASELWDPRFIRDFFKKHTKEVWVEHAVTKKRRKMTLRKDDEVKYPFKEAKSGASGAF